MDHPPTPQIDVNAMTDQTLNLRHQLSSLRGQLRLYRSVEGLLLFTGVSCLLVLTASWFDWVFAPGMLMRWCVWSVIVMGLSVLAWRGIARPWLRQYSDAYLAVLVESRQSGLDNRLINAVQISMSDTAVSPSLTAAIVHDALTSLAGVRAGVLGDKRTMLRHVMSAMIPMLILSVFLILTGPGGWTSMRRMAMPWANLSPFTWTTLQLTPGSNVHVLEGTPLDVSVSWSGREPVLPRIHWVTQDGQHRSLPLESHADTNANYIQTFDAVNMPMQVYATGGDGVSDHLTVTLEPRPRVKSLTAEVTPPAYTSLPATTTELDNSQFTAYPGSEMTLVMTANKPLNAAVLILGNETEIHLQPNTTEPRTWTGALSFRENTRFTLKLTDMQGNTVLDPGVWHIAPRLDTAPLVNITVPGRDEYITAEAPLKIAIQAMDDLGVASVTLMGQMQGKDQQEPVVIHAWNLQSASNQKQLTLQTLKTAKDFGLSPGNSLQYWAVATDRNHITGPGITRSQRYVLTFLTPAQAQTQASEQILNYSQYVGQLLKQQKTNLTATIGQQPAGPLALRQIDIRHQTLSLISNMERSRFEGPTIMTELSNLASREMAQVITGFERARDAATLDLNHLAMATTTSNQNAIIQSLESILQRLDKNEAARKKLKVLAQKSPEQHQQVVTALEKISRDLDRFLIEQKQQEQNYEKMPKRSSNELQGDNVLNNEDPAHRLDRWKKWSKGTIDDLAKLPAGFAKDTHLADTISTIFEEIEKKPRLPTKEMATPAEENAKMQGTELKEDLEMWMMDRGDNLKWVMEDMPEGKFEVPEMTLPENLQDMVGDLIEDAQEFDEDADDATGNSGGNLSQAGWDIMDGPISSFSATGKTGNQLPNNSEITGRSGAGRRGKSSGQMVGSDSAAMEGRPTPARVTNERYEEGEINATSQLDPRGSTGGGKKTGGGEQGLQGGTPPDMVKEMQRLEKNQTMIREKAQQLADALVIQGRSSSQVDHAMKLFEDAQGDMRDNRYHDAARKRKMAVGELRNLQSGAQQAVSLSLDKARALSPELRQEISAGASQPLPQGYEDLVGAYYRALSTAGDGDNTNTPMTPQPSSDKEQSSKP